MTGAFILIALFVGGVLTARSAPASDAVEETPSLVVTDSTRHLSDDALKGWADKAELLPERVLAFWSTDARRLSQGG